MRVAIAGYGIEGEENYRYWQGLGHDVTIVDEKDQPDRPLPSGAKTMLGDGVFMQLQDFDLVIRTAGLAPHKILTDGKIWSSTNEFFEKCPALIVGVTGTKGKGTTASLITSILKADGKTAHLVGNIGVSALSVLADIRPDDIVVFEMSSFQLWDIKKSPQIAVVLPIEPDHLNVHKDMDDYVEAKGNIARLQNMGDTCFYHPENERARYIASLSKSTTVPYMTTHPGSVSISGDTFVRNASAVCSVDALQLLGEHNRENACAAIGVAMNLGCGNEAVEEGLRQFKGLPHRLEHVGQVGGVDYYNDSFSSAPSATIAAMRSFDRPEVVIIGGIDKGAAFDELMTEAVNNHNVKKLVLIGEIRHKLNDLFASSLRGKIFVSNATSMKEVVADARGLASGGDVVILSPACASFDMFKNFYDRGDQFRTIVRGL